MKTLKCNARSCVYNKHTTCAKNSILVGDGDETNNEIKCESYSPLGATAHSYEIAEEMDMVEHSNHEQPNIDCLAAECVYNKQRKCHADEVLIDVNTMSNYSQTVCETYKKQ